MNVELPDGSVLEDVPDGTPKWQILGKLQLANHPAVPAMMKQMAAKQTAEETSAGTKHLAGYGQDVHSIVRAGKKMLGMDAPDENAEIDKELLKTPSGASGKLISNLINFLPLSVIPGANTVRGAGAIGSLIGAFQPTESTGERLKNMGIGGGLGAGTQALTGPVAQRVGEWGASRQAEQAATNERGQVASETLRRGQQAGYTVPPSAVNDSWIARRLESIGGKAAVGQEAALRNQGVTDRLGREAAGLRPDEPLSLQSLRGARQQMSGPYRDVAAIGPGAATDLEALQAARYESKVQWKFYNRSADPQALQAARAADALAQSLEQRLSLHADVAGQPDLVRALHQARTSIAQNRQVQEALNRGTGGVDASVIGRAYDNGAPLSGPLETIGRFQQAYRPYMREGSSVPTPGVSKSEALASAVLGLGGTAATGSPAGAIAGGLPMLSGPVRSLVLSRPYQRMFAQPNESAGVTANTAAMLEDPETRRRAALLARALALPSIPQAVNQ